MEFRSQEDHEGAGFNSPPSGRVSAFSKPTLSPSSSLVFSPSGRAGVIAGGGGGDSGGSASAQAASRNGSAYLETTTKQVNNKGADSDPPNSRQILGRSAATARYKECLKNHAASSGGHVVDGCGEFMAAGEEGTHDALKCAACGCHRSFHRKETDADNSIPYLLTSLPPPPPPPPPQRILLGAPSHRQPQAPPPSFPPGFPQSPIRFNQSGGTPTESSSEELNAVGAEVGTSSKRAAAAAVAEGGRKKRFRTKFTAEQKQKMSEFAERVGWRFLRQDEAAVERFCNETGVPRQVLKVWMHNNKNTLRKSHQETAAPPPQQQEHHQHELS